MLRKPDASMQVLEHRAHRAHAIERGDDVAPELLEREKLDVRADQLEIGVLEITRQRPGQVRETRSRVIPKVQTRARCLYSLGALDARRDLRVASGTEALEQQQAEQQEHATRGDCELHRHQCAE
jgi:hypothetical protein